MAYIANYLLAELAKPTGLWSTLFNWFASFAKNYGWTIVLFTIAVKLLVSPLDFYNRYSTRKNSFIQKRLAGQVQKINLKYQNNREEANRQVSILYKKEGYNMIGSCVFMLINLIVTTVIFFSFFGALREISSYKMLSQYESMERVYYKTLNETESIEAAEQKTLETFLEFEDKNSWLWVKNVWRNDARVNSIPTYNDLVKVANNSGENAHKEYVGTISEEKYNAVTKSIQSENKKWNGYYIIAVLVVLTSLLSQFLSEKMNGTNKNKEAQANAQDPNQATMKMMKFILPAIILIFVLTNTASFGIYILVGNIISIVLNLLFGIFVKKLTQKEEEKYLQHIEREAIRSVKKEHKPRMVTYKNLGDRL